MDSMTTAEPKISLWQLNEIRHRIRIGELPGDPRNPHDVAEADPEADFTDVVEASRRAGQYFECYRVSV